MLQIRSSFVCNSHCEETRLPLLAATGIAKNGVVSSSDGATMNTLLMSRVCFRNVFHRRRNDTKARREPDRIEILHKKWSRSA